MVDIGTLHRVWPVLESQTHALDESAKSTALPCSETEIDAPSIADTNGTGIDPAGRKAPLRKNKEENRING
jgi:hypothetical protein